MAENIVGIRRRGGSARPNTAAQPIVGVRRGNTLQTPGTTSTFPEFTQLEEPPAPPDLKVGERVVGGFLRGVQQDPLTGLLFNKLMDQFPDTPRQTIEELIKRTENSTLSEVFEKVGEFGPAFAIGGGLFSLGRRAAVSVLARLGAKEASKTATGAAAKTTLGRISQRHAGVLHVEELFKKPAIERGAQVVGGALGSGAFFAAEEAAEGGTIPEVGRAALTGAILSAGLEGTAIAAFGLIRRARNIDPAQARKLWVETGAMKVLQDAESAVNTKIEKLSAKTAVALKVARQERELLKGLSSPTVPDFVRFAGGKDAAEGAKKGLGTALRDLKKLQQERRSLRSDLAGLKTMQSDPTVIYTRGTPYNPGTLGTTLAKARLNIMQTPESLKGQLGRTGARFMQLWDEAENLTTIARSVNEFKLLKTWRDASKLMGFGRKTRKNGRNFLPLFSAWESGGEAPVRSYMQQIGRGQHADAMVKLLDELDNDLLTMYSKLAAIGAEPVMTAADLAKMGVAKFFPHVLDDIPENEILERLAKSKLVGSKKPMGMKKAMEFMEEVQREGLTKFGSIDYQRKLLGTLQQKIEHGLPFNDNPFDAIFRYLNSVHMRLNYGQRFGFSGEIKNTILTSAAAEGASVPLVNNLVDLALGHRVYDHGMRQLSRMVTGFQGGSKLTLAVIPNMSQSINTLLFGGFRATSLGMYEALKGEKRSAILQNVALAESVISGVGRAFGEASLVKSGAGAGLFGKLTNVATAFQSAVLRWTRFSAVERWNRVLAGSTGHFILRDTLAKGVNGRLKGHTLDIARRRMESLGVNLDDTVRAIQEGGDAYLRSPAFQELEKLAMFKASTVTQFNPNMLRRPILWNHPVGRVMAQFKTFALGQGRFIRDQVFAEAARGNMKPLAYFASIYPVAGEIIGDAKAIIKGKDRNMDGLERLWSDYMMVGGMGLATDTLTAMRWGRGPEFLLGPAASDFFQFGQNLVQGGGERVVNQVLRTPLFTATTFLAAGGLLTVRGMQDYLDILDEEEPDNQTVVPIGIHRSQKKAQNQ